MSQTYTNLSQDDIDTITDFFNWADKDKDGHITKSEIEDAMAVDLDNDGTLSADERTKGGVQWFQSNFALQDLDKDTSITLAELLKFNNDHKGQ